jgi:hypothetical protein
MWTADVFDYQVQTLAASLAVLKVGAASTSCCEDCTVASSESDTWCSPAEWHKWTQRSPQYGLHHTLHAASV